MTWYHEGLDPAAVAARVLPGVDGFYHVGYVVPDLAAAIDEVPRDFSPPLDRRLAEWDYRIAFTRGGPPYVELIEGPVGSPWDCAGAPRLHHAGFWATPVGACADALGLPVEFDGRPHGRAFLYLRAPASGVRVELLDATLQPSFLEEWDPGAVPQPVMRCG